MKRILPLLLVSLLGCVTNRFPSVATEAAARDACYSSRAVEIERLSSYAFRAHSCAGVTFYRCWYQRKTAGRVQCCARVSTEEEATALFHAAGGWDGEPWCTTS